MGFIRAGLAGMVAGAFLIQGALAMDLHGPSFSHRGIIPKRYTCDGEDLSPALNWSGIPQGTRSFALIVDDPDAPMGTWVHWVIYGLPATLDGLPEGVPRTESLLQGGIQGKNDFGRVGYGGPCPPPGPPHRYFFRLYALDVELMLPPGATKAQLLKAMKGHVLEEAHLMGKYGR